MMTYSVAEKRREVHDEHEPEKVLLIIARRWSDRHQSNLQADGHDVGGLHDSGRSKYLQYRDVWTRRRVLYFIAKWQKRDGVQLQ